MSFHRLFYRMHEANAVKWIETDFFLSSNPRWQRKIACFCVKKWNQFPLPRTHHVYGTIHAFSHRIDVSAVTSYTHLGCVLRMFVMNFDSASVCDGKKMYPKIKTLWDNTKIYRWHLFTSHKLSMPNRNPIPIHAAKCTSVPGSNSENSAEIVMNILFVRYSVRWNINVDVFILRNSSESNWQ